MPWRHTSPLDPKTPCIADSRRRTRSMTAVCTRYGVRRVTRGSTARSHPVHRVWRSARANRAPAPIRRLRTSSRPASHGARITRRGAPRHGWPGSRHVLRAGRSPRAPRVAISAAARAWCPRPDPVDTGAIRGRPPARAWPPTRSGAPRCRATATRATGARVLRSPWPMAPAACAAAVQPALPPAWPRPRPSSPASSPRAVCPRASAPTPGCRVPPPPWAGSPHSPPSGAAWGSSPRASSPAHPHRTAAMHACLARCRRTPRARPPARGGLRRASSRASAKRATASGRTRRSTGAPPPLAMHAPPGRCLPTGHHASLLTAARGATSAPMGAAGGTIKGATSHTSAAEHTLAARHSTMGSGMCSADPCNAVGGANVIGAAKRPLVD
jgi:hypothetical protein